MLNGLDSNMMRYAQVLMLPVMFHPEKRKTINRLYDIQAIP